MKSKKLILLELNEINFFIVRRYIESGIHLPGFSKVIGKNLIQTRAENKYIPDNNAHVSKIHNSILNYFNG